MLGTPPEPHPPEPVPPSVPTGARNSSSESYVVVDDSERSSRSPPAGKPSFPPASEQTPALGTMEAAVAKLVQIADEDEDETPEQTPDISPEQSAQLDGLMKRVEEQDERIKELELANRQNEETAKMFQDRSTRAEQTLNQQRLSWRAREDRLLKLINESERAQAQNDSQKQQIAATQQRLAEEVLTLTKELANEKAALAKSRDETSAVMTQNARLRSSNAVLEEEKRSLLFKVQSLEQSLQAARQEYSDAAARQEASDANPPDGLNPLAGELPSRSESDQVVENLRKLVREVQLETRRTPLTNPNVQAKFDSMQEVLNPVQLALSSSPKASPTSSAVAAPPAPVSPAQPPPIQPPQADKKLQQEMLRLQQEVAHLKRQLSEKERFQHELIKKNETLQRRVSQVQEEKELALAAIRNNMTQLLQENKRVTDHFVQQAQDMQGWKSNSEKWKKRAEEFETLLDHKTAEHNQFSVKVDSAETHKIGLEKKLSLFENQLNEARDRCELLQQNKEVLGKRCLSLEEVIEGIKMNDMKKTGETKKNEGDGAWKIENRCDTLLKEKFDLQRQIEESDGKLHDLQEHVFDLEADLQARDLEVELLNKKMKEREFELNVRAKEISDKVRAQLAKRQESRDIELDEDYELDEFGLKVNVDQGLLASVLIFLFPGFFQDEAGTRAI